MGACSLRDDAPAIQPQLPKSGVKMRQDVAYWLSSPSSMHKDHLKGDDVELLGAEQQ